MSDAKQLTQWVLQLRDGNGEAFEKIYNATNQSGYFGALKIIKDPHEAEDILRSSYISVLKNIGTLKDPEKFRSWFNQIVANTARNALLKKKPSLFTSDEEEQYFTECVEDTDTVFYPHEQADKQAGLFSLFYCGQKCGMV